MLLALPIVVPFATAALALVAWRWMAVQRWLGVAGSLAQLAVALWLLAVVDERGILVLQVGGWPAPFGITLVADRFAALMVLLGAGMGFGVAVYSLGTLEERDEASGYHPLLQVLLMGVSGAFLTGDLFNLYVWFEVMLIASFVLLSLRGERAQMEGGITYVTLNLIASAVFLAGIGILYGKAGTLNFADLARHLNGEADPATGTVVSMLFLVAFGIKAAVFPLFFWLPASYHTPPAAVSAIFAALLTKVGVYAMMRMFTLVFTTDVAYTHELILVLSALTMVTGVLGAVTQRDFRRILSFHIISQIGYMTLGLGLFSRAALAGSIFYIAHHIVVKANLFLVSGVAHRLRGTYSLDRLGGLARDQPWLALLFLVPAMSLAGLPPLSGFFAKLLLVEAGLEGERYGLVAVALGVGLLTLFSMTKIWSEAFWKAPPASAELAAPARSLAYLVTPIAILAGVTLGIGFGVETVFGLADRAAAQLLEPGAYIQAVLGGAR